MITRQMARPVEDLSKLRHNLAAKRSRDRKKQQRLQGQASTSGNADVASANVANRADVAEMLTW